MSMTEQELLNIKQKLSLQAFTVSNDLKMALADVIFHLANGDGGIEQSIGRPPDDKQYLRAVVPLNTTVSLVQRDALRTALDFLKLGVTIEFFPVASRGTDNIRIGLPLEAVK